MTSLLISSDDPSIGSDLARRIAEEHGYAHVGADLLAEIASAQDIDLQALRWALEGTGGRKVSKRERDRLLCHIRAATLEALSADNVVCCDLGAHLYVKNVSHILHLRVLADPDARVAALMDEQGYSARKAKKVLDKERQSRERWTMECFGANEQDAALYDIVVQLKQIDTDRVLQIIRDTVAFRGFQTMTYSRRCLQDLVLASQVRAALLNDYPEVHVRADGDRAIVHVKCAKRKKANTVAGVKAAAGAVAGVGLVEVHTVSNLREVAVPEVQDPRQFINGDDAS